MSIEQRVKNLESRLNNLQAAFIQSQKNQVPITAKTDATAGAVEGLTPYTETKTAYIGDTSVTFSPVPSGNVSVFIDGNYTVSREQDRLTVEFEALTEPKEVTISIL